MTEQDQTAIKLAAAYYRWPPVRDRDVLETLGRTPFRLSLYVGGLLERPDVLAAHPAEVRRIQRLREARRRQRSVCRVSA